MNDLQLITPPRTIMEVFKMLPEGTLAELINGNLYMSPAPTPKHQRIVLKLTSTILDFIEQGKMGEVFLSPCDVFFDEHSNAVQPDIIYVSFENSFIVKEDESIQGVPDLLIEILSSGNSKHDKVRKKDLYEKFGVKEYWIVNPDTKETIGYTLKNGEYKEIGIYSGKIESILLNHSFEF
jgi:Uma2 family endonuclease